LDREAILGPEIFLSRKSNVLFRASAFGILIDRPAARTNLYAERSETSAVDLHDMLFKIVDHHDTMDIRCDFLSK